MITFIEYILLYNYLVIDKMTIGQISKTLHMSRSGVYGRIKKLKNVLSRDEWNEVQEVLSSHRKNFN